MLATMCGWATTERLNSHSAWRISPQAAQTIKGTTGGKGASMLQPWSMRSGRSLASLKSLSSAIHKATHKCSIAFQRSQRGFRGAVGALVCCRSPMQIHHSFILLAGRSVIPRRAHFPIHKFYCRKHCTSPACYTLQPSPCAAAACELWIENGSGGHGRT